MRPKKPSHYHILKIMSSFTEEARVSIIMKTIAGCHLGAFMKDMNWERKSIPRSFFGCLVSGLKAIHDAGIRHKDIKPENIPVKGRVILYTDFGIALDYSQTNRGIMRGRPAMFSLQNRAACTHRIYGEQLLGNRFHEDVRRPLFHLRVATKDHHLRHNMFEKDMHYCSYSFRSLHPLPLWNITRDDI